MSRKLLNLKKIIRVSLLASHLYEPRKKRIQKNIRSRPPTAKPWLLHPSMIETSSRRFCGSGYKIAWHEFFCSHLIFLSSRAKWQAPIKKQVATYGTADYLHTIGNIEFQFWVLIGDGKLLLILCTWLCKFQMTQWFFSLGTTKRPRHSFNRTQNVKTSESITQFESLVCLIFRFLESLPDVFPTTQDCLFQGLWILGLLARFYSCRENIEEWKFFLSKLCHLRLTQLIGFF